MGDRPILSRKNFLKGIGVGAVLVAGGGVWHASRSGVFSAGEGPAYEPWKSWRTDNGKGPLALVRAAILAANPHNTQPWLFRLSESRIDIFADTDRNIGTIDPYRREMYTGLGCAIENLLLAAEANGYVHQLKLSPDKSDPTHAAAIDLEAGEAKVSELYEAIPDRHTNRGPHDMTRTVPAEILTALATLGKDIPEAAIFWFTTELERRRFCDFETRATEALVADEEQSADSFRWGRMKWKDVQRYRDGVTLDSAPIPPVIRAIAKMMPPPPRETADGYFLDAMKSLYDNTAVFGILAVRDARDNSQRLQGGRLWQRMHLWGTIQGLGMGPINQIPERADRESSLGIDPIFGDALKELIDDPEWQTLLPFRVGYPTMKALPSPRRDVKDVLL